MTNNTKFNVIFRGLWLAGMLGMVVTAPLWVPFAVYEKLAK